MTTTHTAYYRILHHCVQRRSTDTKGNTVWLPTPLTDAMENGRLCILDGLDRLAVGVIAVLARLLSDREIELFDGRRFMSRVRTYHTPCLPSLPPSPSLPSSSPRLVHVCVAFYLAFILPLSFYQPTHTLSSFFPLTQAPFPSLSHTLPSHLDVSLDVPLGVLPLHVSGTSRAAFR